MKMKVDIVGAGIGGLTTAIALKKAGIETFLFESANAFKPVGAGIILANNAMQVHKSLGMDEAIQEHSNYISALNITDQNLKILSGADLTSFETKYGVKNRAIHRAKLQEILIERVGIDNIKLSSKLTKIQELDSHCELVFENGTTHSSALVIGADGIQSQVIKDILNSGRIRATDQHCWRGVVQHKLDNKYIHQLTEAWGKGDRFGFVQIDTNLVYWYALKSMENQNESLNSEQLGAHFSNYHPLVKELIISTPDDKIHFAKICDLQPINKWHTQKVCLIGDAAHATTPNLGQGACQSIEDGYVLAKCFEKYGDKNAFAKFQNLRIKKATKVVNSSWNIGKVSHWKNPMAIKVRNFMMRNTPKAISTKQSDWLYKLPEV